MTMTKLITDLRRKLTGATTELQGEIARLRGAIEERRKDLQHARNAPLPVEEIVEVIALLGRHHVGTTAVLAVTRPAERSRSPSAGGLLPGGHIP